MTHRRTVVAAAAGLWGLSMVGQAWAQVATPAIQSELGVVYGDIDGAQLLLDVYRPASSGAAQPTVLLFYPGGFGAGERSWMAEQAQALAGAGYIAVVPDYRLLSGSGENLWPTQLDDAQRAVRWVRANAGQFGVDPDRIGAYGYSAGGMLAAHLAMRETRDNADPDLASYSSRVTCAIDIASIADLTKSTPNPGIEAGFVDLIGGTFDEMADAYIDASPVTHVDGNTVPMLLLYGIDDTFVSIEQGRRLADVLHGATAEVVYGEFAGIDHLDWSWAPSAGWTLAFLERYLGG